MNNKSFKFKKQTNKFEDFSVDKKYIPSDTHLEIEKSVLALLMETSSARTLGLMHLRRLDFLYWKHRWLFGKIYDFTTSRKDNDWDFNLLASYLNEDLNVYQNFGGLTHLLEIKNSYVEINYLKKYIKILHQVATQYQLTKAIKKWNEDEVFKNQVPDDSFKQLFKQLNQLEKFYTHQKNDIRSLEDYINEYADNISTFEHEKDEVSCTTGLASLDEKTNGFHRGDLAILAARPSMGKTALALKTAMAHALPTNTQKDEGDIIIFSLEMSWQQLVQRVLKSHLTGFNVKNFDSESVEDIKKFNRKLNAHNVFIDSSMTLDVHKLHFKLTNWSAKRKIKLVIIDYLQLLKSIETKSFGHNNRNQEVSYWTRSLKETARELDIPILCLSQLSRSVEKREEKRPLLSDLRDSGSIEQDADLVLFLYRENYYQRKKEKEEGEDKSFNAPSIAEIIIAKQRNGPTGTVKALFIPSETTFYDVKEENTTNE